MSEEEDFPSGVSQFAMLSALDADDDAAVSGKPPLPPTRQNAVMTSPIKQLSRIATADTRGT